MKVAGVSAKAWRLGYLYSDDQMTPISGYGTTQTIAAVQQHGQFSGGITDVPRVRTAQGGAAAGDHVWPLAERHQSYEST
jgi:hypothetical protein